MDSTSEGDELIDVVVRLPRRAVENSLLSAIATEREAKDRWLRAARGLIASRRKRAALFNGIRFYDPNWDMILELYVAHRECRPLSVSRLCSLSGGSTTTALRHIEHLEAMGYISREPDVQDRRRANVAILLPLCEALEAWLDLEAAASRMGA